MRSLFLDGSSLDGGFQSPLSWEVPMSSACPVCGCNVEEIPAADKVDAVPGSEMPGRIRP